ncbi:MAG: hypothetical protein FGM46_09370 [Ferruginibacter sp.]|nr:hypothetical protein [Ferruginibacter sp.]
MHKGLLIFCLLFIGIAQVDFPENMRSIEAVSASIQVSDESTSVPVKKMPIGTQGELEEDSSDEDGIPVDFYPSQNNLPIIIIYQILKPISASLFQPDAFTPPPRLI